VQLILRKSIKIVATIMSDFKAPDPARKTCSVPRHPSWNKGDLFLREEARCMIGKEMKG